MIATQSRVLTREPVFSVDGDNPLHFSLLIGWNSEESLIGVLARSVGAAYRTTSVRHSDSRGDKTQQQPILICVDPQ